MEESIEESKGRYVSTGSVAVDKSLGGGFPEGKVSGVFAGYDVGKTLLMAQTASYFWHLTKKAVCYIDTEKSFKQPEDKAKVIGMFKKRWKMQGDPEIVFKFPTNIHELMRMLGKKLTVKDKIDDKTGELVMTIAQVANETDEKHFPLYMETKEKKYGLIILDSITELIENCISIPPRQNFPARKTITKSIVARLDQLASDFNIPVILTIHESADPARGKLDTGAPVGGATLRYTIKHMIQIRGHPHGEKRTFHKFRWFGEPSSRTSKEGLEVTLVKDVGYSP